MSSAVIRNGHWRRRDPLKGLSPAMLAELRALHEAPERGKGRGVDLRTLHALADRALIRRQAGPDGLLDTYVLTREGRAIVGEMQRRDAARAQLIAERPTRAYP